MLSSMPVRAWSVVFAREWPIDCRAFSEVHRMMSSLDYYGMREPYNLHLQRRLRFVPSCRLLISVRDLENPRFIKRFTENLQTDW